MTFSHLYANESVSGFKFLAISEHSEWCGLKLMFGSSSTFNLLPSQKICCTISSQNSLLILILNLWLNGCDKNVQFEKRRQFSPRNSYKRVLSKFIPFVRILIFRTPFFKSHLVDHLFCVRIFDGLILYVIASANDQSFLSKIFKKEGYLWQAAFLWPLTPLHTR